MPAEPSLQGLLHKLLQSSDLPFRDFVELALYHPVSGYYTSGRQRVGKDADYVTAPLLSPLFGDVISGLFREFVSRAEGEVCSFVDIGCGDGSLVAAVAAKAADEARFFGIDRSLSRVPPERRESASVQFCTSLDEVPRDGAHLVFSSELYDAMPFARLVQREEHLHELWVTERDGALDWTEHEAEAAYEEYFAARGIELESGQFADVSLEWEAYHEDVARLFQRGLLVTLDYGYPARKLFHPRARRFGTAAAYSRQRVSRDLLASPGEQDLTAHINFDDLQRAGSRRGWTTIFLDRLALFLLAAGAAEHEVFRPIEESALSSLAEGMELLQQREDARRLVLPDGIGEEMRVLVQTRGMGHEKNWSFQRKLF